MWITGLPGVGKTELSDRITRELRQSFNVNVIQLDGDLLRLVLDQTLAISDGERKSLGITYFNIATMLAQQSQIVIVSAVAQYAEIYELIENGSVPTHIINLTCTEEIMISRINAREISPSAEKTILNDPRKPFKLIEFPKNTRHFKNNSPSDLVNITREVIDSLIVYINKTKEIPRDSIRKQTEKYLDIKNFTNNYWNSYYRSSVQFEPSSFAKFVSQNYITANSRVIDFGCGNGRDTFLFGETCATLGLDVSSTAISSNKSNLKEVKTLNTLEFGVLDKKTELKNYFDSFSPTIFYARFVFHAFDEKTEDEVLKLLSDKLPANGLLCVEVRTINDPLYKRGIKVSKTERIYGHYRRFADARVFLDKLHKLNFKIIFTEENMGLSKIEDDNPVLLRVIGQLIK